MSKVEYFQNSDLGEVLLKLMYSGFEGFVSILMKKTSIEIFCQLMNFYQSFARNELLKIFEKIISFTVKLTDIHCDILNKIINMLKSPEIDETRDNLCIE